MSARLLGGYVRLRAGVCADVRLMSRISVSHETAVKLKVACARTHARACRRCRSLFQQAALTWCGRWWWA